MIKMIKSFIAKRKQKIEEKKKMAQMQKYYEVLRGGAIFIKFIQDDLQTQSNSMNRSQRRRLQKTVLKGELTEELINHYRNNIERILGEIEERMNPAKSIDGAKM